MKKIRDASALGGSPVFTPRHKVHNVCAYFINLISPQIGAYNFVLHVTTENRPKTALHHRHCGGCNACTRNGFGTKNNTGC